MPKSADERHAEMLAATLAAGVFPTITTYLIAERIGGTPRPDGRGARIQDAVALYAEVLAALRRNGHA